MGCGLAARWAAAVAVGGATGWPTSGLGGGGQGCGQGCHAAHPAHGGPLPTPQPSRKYVIHTNKYIFNINMYMFSFRIFLGLQEPLRLQPSGPLPHPVDLPWEPQSTPLPAQVGHNKPIVCMYIFFHTYVCILLPFFCLLRLHVTLLLQL